MLGDEHTWRALYVLLAVIAAALLCAGCGVGALVAHLLGG